MKKKIIFVSIIVLLIIMFYWLFTHSFIEVSTNINNVNNIRYTLTATSSEKQIHINGKKSVKKLVRKGNYEVLVQNGETSYFTTTNASGFLSTSTIQARLEPEKNRKFVGDNPAGCMFNVGKLLASVDCGDLHSQLKLHVAATASQPTYTRNSPGLVDGIIEGSATTSQGIILLLKSPAGTNHTAYILDPELNLLNKVLLSDLDKNNSYFIQPYRDGFIVYDATYSKILYYSSIDSRPVTIPTKKPDDKKLIPNALYAQNDEIILSYSNDLSSDILESGQDKEPEKPNPPKKVTTVLTVTNNQETKQYTFKKSISNFRLCGTNKLCILSNKLLEVYDTLNTKPRFLYAISGVERIDFTNKKLIVVKNDAVIGLDVDKKSGSIQYGFGEYKSCGYAPSDTGYIVCISNDNQKNYALSIDMSTPNKDSIDKKILPFFNLPSIKSFSIYDKYIFVSPEVGEVVFNPDSSEYEYDATTIKTTNTNIDKAFDESGIDKNNYQIINPFK